MQAEFIHDIIRFVDYRVPRFHLVTGFGPGAVPGTPYSALSGDQRKLKSRDKSYSLQECR